MSLGVGQRSNCFHPVHHSTALGTLTITLASTVGAHPALNLQTSELRPARRPLRCLSEKQNPDEATEQRRARLHPSRLFRTADGKAPSENP